MDYLSQMVINDDWQPIAHDSKKEKAADLKLMHPALLLVHGKYTSSINSFASPLPASGLTAAQKELLIEYYEHPPAELKRVIQKRRNEHDLQCCPYCGYPYIPDTLDHFVPKDYWPEFSFFPNNLVPQCRGCAPIKGSAYYCSDKHACFFIHPMYFPILSKTKINISVAISRAISKPEFNVKVTVETADASEASRVATHLNKLKMKARTLAYCRREFNHLKNQLIARHFNIKDLLRHTIESRTPINGPARDWKTALYQAIHNNDDAVDYLHSFRPPAAVAQKTGLLAEMEVELE